MLIKPFFYEPIKHLFRLVSDPVYLSWCLQAGKLAKVDRYKECHTSTQGMQLQMPDSASFLSAYKEIFVNRIYQFSSASIQPRILDLGANIGLSVLFFKSIYPEAKITAFEADPGIFRYLKNNVHGNGFDDVVLINKAVWNENRVLKFYAEGADGGHVAEADDEKTLEIEAVDISEVLNEGRFDFIKMDIEGAEETVLPACKGHLTDIQHVFVEYHSKIGQKQRLAEILALLADEGFRVDMYNPISCRQPFVNKTVISGFDLQLNIFASKE